MSKFIKLHGASGTLFYVNPDNITDFYTDSAGTHVNLIAPTCVKAIRNNTEETYIHRSLSVIESSEQIYNML